MSSKCSTIVLLCTSTAVRALIPKTNLLVSQGLDQNIRVPVSKMISQPTKANVLLVGSGGVGTMASYALEMGGQAEVTAVLRSNYEAVQKAGFFIDSIEHGNDIEGWKPTNSKKSVQQRDMEQQMAKIMA